jgi:capsular polysaccharide biosynthesis protein
MEKNSSALQFFYKNRKLLLVSIILGGILGIGVTFFIPRKYQSTAIVYPYNSHARAEIIVNPTFGFELEAEQLLQLLESKTMRDRTVEKFDLINYYGLDNKNPQSQDLLMKMYIVDVVVSKSKYLSIVVNVSTRIPELSAKIANFQIEEVDRYRQSIFDENRKQEFGKIEKEYFDNEKKLENLRDSIYSIKTNKNQLLYNFIESLNNENYNSAEFVNDPKLELIVDRYLFLFRLNVGLRSNYLKMQQAISQPLPSVYVIDKAVPSYRKASPSIMINGIVGAMVLFALTLTFKLVLSKFQELKENN